jgi:hypothetical protein
MHIALGILKFGLYCSTDGARNLEASMTRDEAIAIQSQVISCRNSKHGLDCAVLVFLLL